MYCAACGKQVAEEDAFCRNCGASQKPGATQSASPPQVSTPDQVTVRNPYIGKNIQIFGVLLFIVGVLWSYGCASLKRQDNNAGWPLLLSLAGLVCFLVGRVKHWYHSE
jgi:uncharacterized membrane protein YvbJ